jgi:membrane protein implicated in regulation of membrane protease activity
MAASAVLIPNGPAPFRPFPWCLAPDWVFFVWGALILVFIWIPTFAMIAVSIGAGHVYYAMYDWIGFVKKVHDQSRTHIDRVSQDLGKKMLKDPRNYPYIPWTLFHSVVLPALFAMVYVRYRQHGFEFLPFLAYHLVRMGPRFRAFALHHVLIHKEGHDKQGFYKGQFAVFNLMNQFWCGLFYGSVPNSYAVAHNKIHHRWHNDVDDVHSNLDVDRTKFASYVMWLPRFFLYWTGLTPVVLFVKRHEFQLAYRMAFGMFVYYSFVAAVAYHNWCFCFWFCIYPHLEAISFLGAIAYLWHSFVSPTDPTNQYINSITIINGKYNVFNEDYHVVHHHCPGVHWTEMPAKYEKHKDAYAACNATIFENTEEGELLYWMFTQQWDVMADHWVDLNGKLNHEQKKALILDRLSYVAIEGGIKAARDILQGTRAEKGPLGPERSFASWGASSVRDWDDDKMKDQ